MATIETLHEDIKEIKSSVRQILEILEEHELTEGAKKALKEARATPDGKYISHEDARK